MLVLSRKPGESVVIGGGIIVRVVEVRGNRVRLAFDAPAQVAILRGELAEWHDAHVGADRERKRNRSETAGDAIDAETISS